MRKGPTILRPITDLVADAIFCASSKANSITAAPIRTIQACPQDSPVALCQANRRGGVAMRGTGAAVGEAANYWLPGFKHCFDPEPMDRRFF